MGADKASRAVGLLDLLTRLPAVLIDAPVILRGARTGLLAQPDSRASIGKVFAERAARYGDKTFLRYGDEKISYSEANETANRYAAVLAERGVGRGDVVGIMERNSPDVVLTMLAAVKCGAVAGMLNHHQREEVLAHSIGLLGASVVVAEADLIDPIRSSGAALSGVEVISAEDFAAAAVGKSTANPASALQVQAKDPAFYIFTSGTTGHPKASVMTHLRWLRALAAFGGLGLRLRGSDTLYCPLPMYHNNALTVALSSVIDAGATLALGRGFSASRFFDEIRQMDATAFVYIGEVCRYLLNQPPRADDRAHKIRVIVGNGLRPEIWQDPSVRYRPGSGVLRRQRGKHRLYQRLQRPGIDRGQSDAAGLRRV